MRSSTTVNKVNSTEQHKIVVKRQGIMRLLYTCKHTFNGLKWMCRNEAAFQQELMLFVPLTVLACVVNISAAQSAILVLALLFVLFAELVNTAIEVVVDRIGLEFNTLSGLAKDIASAFVFISMLMAVIVWWAVLWP
ncbi:diacylglycerol kinase [Shewanella saliphila]|uniref:Diacylglycerol kinase n=1 Tax=Shewanella saliphila TaxID=2282698 RepID=A0ABQ2Q4G3_9GAMM|nr:diacylglycerol kinase [Shewanella saliphila]MCL1101061.1 diacylglycerol kinase [Shewanella saliphila]GGP44336.1 diacylglycerol kinase [Shewanella saliphila]